MRLTVWDIARLRAEENFSISFSLSGLPETKDFVARHEELNEIHHMLHSNEGPSTVTVRGLGGIGKTQLAAKYARGHKDDSSAVFLAE